MPKNTQLLPKGAELKFRGVIFEVYQWPQKMYDGSIETFEMLKAPDTVMTIALRGDKIIISKEKQPPRNEWYYSFPGGRHDHASENELMAAKRELLEESGLEFKNWKLIETRQPNSKIDRIVYTFLATDCIGEHPQKLDAGEKIERQELTFQELKQLSKDPSARYVNHCCFAKVNSLQELLDLPALYNYD